jgi:phage terminase large subunit GpA-like protein
LELAGVRPNYTSLFVSPSAMQTKVFSVTRIDDIIDVSPALRALKDTRLTYNLLEKSFINGSKIYLRYAFLSADRIRGLSVNSLFLDEIQDLLTELLPVIEETTSHHKSPFFLYSGTPKTFDNTIEKLWSKSSTQNEWAIPCDAHTPTYWNILGIKNIGKNGPICSKCGKLLNPEHPRAQWGRSCRCS